MVNAISNALNGMTAATRKADTAASNIANATTPGFEVDLAKEAVDLKVAEFSYKANAKVVATLKSMDEELGRILDEKA